MASNTKSTDLDDDGRQIPEEISAEEHGTITLAFRDERVGDDTSFEMPERDS